MKLSMLQMKSAWPVVPLLQMSDAAATKLEEPEDSDFEVDVEDDDDVPLAKKKQKSARFVTCS